MHYRWFADDEEKKDELTGLPKSRVTAEPTPTPLKKPRYFSRTMLTGMLLSIILLCYGIGHRDMPVIFLAASFIIGAARSLTNFLPKKVGQSLSNLMFGFSIALFFGAILMIF